MADEKLVNKVRDLNDLELALLLCLVAKEHCIVTTDHDALDELVQELQLVRLSSTCHHQTPRKTLLTYFYLRSSAAAPSASPRW